MRSQGAEPAGLRLPPVVDDDLVHHVEQIELDGADGAVRHDKSARLDPSGLQQRGRLGEPGRLDEDVGVLVRLLGRRHRPHPLAQVGAEPLGEGVPRIGSLAGHADLVEVEQVVQHHHVPPRRAPRAGVTQHLAVRPGQVARSDGCHRAGPRLGDHGGVEDGPGDAGSRVVQRDQTQLAGQSLEVVGHEVAHHLDAADVEPGQMSAQDVEVPSAAVVGYEVYPRFEDDLPEPVIADRALHRADDVCAGQAQVVDVGAADEAQPDLAVGQRCPHGQIQVAEWFHSRRGPDSIFDSAGSPGGP